MLRKLYIEIIGDNSKLDIVRAAAQQIVYRDETKTSGKIQLLLNMDKQNIVSNLLILCKDLGLHPFIAQRVEYTKKEKETAALYTMWLPKPFEKEGTFAKDYGTKYMGGCEICGIEGVPVADILVNVSFIKKYQIGSLRPEIFVSKEMLEFLRNEHFSGIEVHREIKDYRGQETPLFYHLDIVNRMPPMAKTTWLIPDESNFSRKRFPCGHSVQYLKSDVQYEENTLASLCDFNLSHEYVNNFREPVIIVSKRVRDAMLKKRIYASFSPVTILDKGDDDVLFRQFVLP